MNTFNSGTVISSAAVNANFTNSCVATGVPGTGGQTIYGGDTSAASVNLTLDSTANATKGYVIIAPSSGKVGIGTTTPGTTLDVNGGIRAGSTGVTTGGACTPEGTMGYDKTAHAPVYCNSSLIWVAFGAPSETTATCAMASGGSCTATCPAGYVISGGGFYGNDPLLTATATPLYFYPSGNSWVCGDPSAATQGGTCYAVCLK